MFKRCSRQELVLVGLVLVCGALLRWRHTEQLAIEHYDEGIYSSVTWFDGNWGEPYPQRHLYAPPLLPQLIDYLSFFPGAEQIAPFLPSLVTGVATIFAVWWVARSFFGAAAGYVGLFLAGFSEFHIAFSRMALTDVPTMFCQCLAVGLGAQGIESGNRKRLIAAGAVCAIGWWIKYTGWLPLAVLSCGSIGWWILSGRRYLGFGQLAGRLAIVIGTAFVLWSPWLWMLQDVGGYAAVRANQQGYFAGLSGWGDGLHRHLLFQISIDSWMTSFALALGMLAAGTRRWVGLRRSTWNESPSGSQVAPIEGNKGSEGSTWNAAFPPMMVLVKFVGAAVAALCLALGIQSFNFLLCVGIGGMAGMFLWQNCEVLYRCSTWNAELDPAIKVPLTQTDKDSAASVSPALGACLVVVWFLSMLIMIPQYYPYPRLSLALLVPTWLMAAGGFAWWIEATLNVARREAAPQDPLTRFGRAITAFLLMGALALAVDALQKGDIEMRASQAWSSRASLRDASWQAAESMLQDATGNQQPDPNPDADQAAAVPVAEAEADVEAPQEVSLLEAELARVAPVRTSLEPLADLGDPKCVVYSAGEPALLAHLTRAGIVARPVTDLNFPVFNFQGKEFPTYLVLGPNSLRTPGLLNDFVAVQHRFRLVGEYRFTVSRVVAYNLFRPGWIDQHNEAIVQKLELYRLKSD